MPALSRPLLLIALVVAAPASAQIQLGPAPRAVGAHLIDNLNICTQPDPRGVCHGTPKQFDAVADGRVFFSFTASGVGPNERVNHTLVARVAYLQAKHGKVARGFSSCRTLPYTKEYRIEAVSTGRQVVNGSINVERIFCRRPASIAFDITSRRPLTGASDAREVGASFVLDANPSYCYVQFSGHHGRVSKGTFWPTGQPHRKVAFSMGPGQPTNVSFRLKTCPRLTVRWERYPYRPSKSMEVTLRPGVAHVIDYDTVTGSGTSLGEAHFSDSGF